MKKLDENELRLRIQKILEGNKKNLSNLQIDQLVEEVNIYHRELEYQNVELRRIQNELEVTTDRYKSLFEDAPIGYVICDENFIIRESNVAFVALVKAHEGVLNQSLNHFVHPDWQDEFSFMKQKIAKNQQVNSFDLMLMVNEMELPVRITVNRHMSFSEVFYRFAFNDISTEKTYEHHLKERIKELDCLYNFSNLLQNTRINIDDLLESAVLLLPVAMQYPEKACARILYNQKQYHSQPFFESDLKITAALKIKDKPIGQLEVLYVAEKTEGNRIKFLKEEKKLLETLALNLSDYLERRLIELAVFQSNENLRITLKSIGDAVISTDLEGRINQMNSIAENLTGWTFAEAEGKNIEEVFRIINSRTNEQADNLVTKVRELEIIVGMANHTRLISRNGQEYHIADSGAPILNENGEIQGVVMVFRDVTHDYIMQQQLAESEERFSKLFRNSPIPASLSTLEDSKLADVNEAWSHYFGYQKEECVGKTLVDLGILQPIHENEIREMLLKTGKVEGTEFNMTTKNGDKVNILASIEVALLNGIEYLISSYADITEFRQAEEALLGSESRFRSYVENANDIIYEVSPDGFFTYTSPNWTQILGYELHEVIGASVDKFVHKEDVSLCMNYLNQIMVDSKPINNVEYRVKHKDGSWRWHSSNGAALRNEYGIPVSYIGIARDITDLKEARIRQNETMQIVSAAFNSVDSLLAVIDKDFRVVLSNWRDHEWVSKEERLNQPICYKSLKRIYEPCKNCPPMQTIKDGIPRFFEAQNPKDGSFKEISVYPIYDENGEISYVLENVRDITKRKQSEQVILDMNQRYETIVSNFPNGAIFMFNKAFECTHVDGRILSQTGLTKEHFIGRRPEETLPPEVSSVIVNQLGKIFNKEECYYEVEMFGRTLANWGVAIPNNTGVIQEALVYALDITQLKENERLIIESEKRFSLLVSNLQTGVFYVNTKGEVLATNPALINLLGSPSEEATKQINIFEYKPLKQFGYTQKLRECIDKGEIVYGEGNYLTKWGKNIFVKYYFVPIFNNGKVTGALASLEDQTQQKTAALKIENAEKRFRALIENAPDGLKIVSLEGKIMYISPNSLRLFGYKETEVINHSGAEFVHPDDLPAVLNVCNEIAYYPERKPTISYRFRIKSGEYRWIETTFTNLLNDEAVGGFVLNFTDITERRNLIENLVKAKEKAEENDKLKSAFLANMSHEIRTPMNGIIGFTSLLSEPDITKEERHQFLGLIEKAGHKLMNTVNDLIDISKIETGQMPVALSLFEVKESVENMYDFYKAEAKLKGIEMILRLNDVDNCTHIKTDPMKFESIFTNLLKNSIKYTDTGIIEVGCKLLDRSIEFYVKDSGIGIPPDRQEAVFNRFEQAKFRDKHAVEGSGLGLAISKAYVEMLGGKIWLESKENVGTTFYFTLPMNK